MRSRKRIIAFIIIIRFPASCALGKTRYQSFAADALFKFKDKQTICNDCREELSVRKRLTTIFLCPILIFRYSLTHTRTFRIENEPIIMYHQTILTSIFQWFVNGFWNQLILESGRRQLNNNDYSNALILLWWTSDCLCVLL